jgi:hypothetical protein
MTRSVIRTETGSRYELDSAAMTWHRVPSLGSGHLRSKGGAILSLSPARIGAPAVITCPPLAGSIVPRVVMTSRVEAVEEADADEVDAAATRALCTRTCRRVTPRHASGVKAAARNGALMPSDRRDEGHPAARSRRAWAGSAHRRGGAPGLGLDPSRRPSVETR